MKLIEPKLSYIEKITFDECLKEMKFQDIHIDENYEREMNLDHLTFDGCLFENCQGRYSNYASSSLQNVYFKHTDLQEASFYDTHCKKIELKDTSLIRCELTSLHHKGLDVSSCQIQGALFDLQSLKNLVINDFQAVDLIGILGVKVK